MPTLHDVVSSDSLAEIRPLLRQGANINETDSAGKTAIMLAIGLRKLPLVNYFLRRDVDRYVINDKHEITLDLASHVDKDLAKRLVIKHATEAGYVETNIDDTNTVLENKLITTLLYQSKRQGWQAQDCVNLRYFLKILNREFQSYSETQFNQYIRAQEAQNHDFYGSYLSDNSDSDEEKEYQELSHDVKSEYKAQANTFQQRGQLSNLFFKKRSGEGARGDIKPLEKASSIFNLSDRTTISHGQSVDLRQVRQDLRHLNRLLAEGISQEEAQSQVETRFFVAQYRGITHLISKWNKTSRVAHRQDDEIGKAQYSTSVLKDQGIDIFSDYVEARERMEQNQESLERQAQTLKQILLTLREPLPCSNEHYSYTNYAYLLQNLYTQDYDGFHRLLRQDPLLQAIFPNSVNPFLSTGDTPYHALKYAYGIKPYKGHGDERLHPRWQRNGRAERPYSGITYVSLHPITDYDKDGPLHLISLNRNGEIKLTNELNIIAERESCFPAYMPRERVIYKHVAKYLSFRGPYKQIYDLKYGITPYFYTKLQTMLAHAAPHSKEMTDFKKILGEWLCSYYEVKLIEHARKTAEARGGVLVYRDINGGFSLTPPIDSVNRNTNAMSGHIKSPIKMKQQLRRAMAAKSQIGVRILEKKAEIKNITQNMAEMGLSGSGEYSVFEEGNSGLNIYLSMAINAIREKRYLALQQLLSTPDFAIRLNTLFSIYQLESASLPHITVLRDDAQALQYTFRSHIANMDTEEQTRPEDIYHSLVAMKSKLPLIDKKSGVIAPAFRFFTPGPQPIVTKDVSQYRLEL